MPQITELYTAPRFIRKPLLLPLLSLFTMVTLYNRVPSCALTIEEVAFADPLSAVVLLQIKQLINVTLKKAPPASL